MSTRTRRPTPPEPGDELADVRQDIESIHRRQLALLLHLCQVVGGETRQALQELAAELAAELEERQA